MKNISVCSILFLTSLGVCAPFGPSALAQSHLAFKSAESGVYVSPNLGYGHADLTNGSYTGDKASLVVTPNIGYQFNNFFAFELGYTHFAKMKGNVDAGSAAPTTNVSVKNHYVDAAFKASYPLSSRLQIFAKAGFARVYTDYSSNVSETGGSTVAVSAGTYKKNLLLLGGGLGYAVNPKMRVNLQIASTPSSYAIPALLTTTIGVSHIFAI